MPDEPQDQDPVEEVVEDNDDHGVEEGLLELYTALEAEKEGML